MYDKDYNLKTRLTKGHNELYYIDEVEHHPNQQGLLLRTLLTQSEKVVLIHCQLGHSSLKTLKFLFPSIYRSLIETNFLCEVCQLIKHT